MAHCDARKILLLIVLCFLLQTPNEALFVSSTQHIFFAMEGDNYRKCNFNNDVFRYFKSPVLSPATAPFVAPTFSARVFGPLAFSGFGHRGSPVFSAIFPRSQRSTI